MKTQRLLFVILSMLLLSVEPVRANDLISEITGLTNREARIITRAQKRAKAQKLGSVCKNVTNLNGLLLKITAGGHIGRGDPRYSGWSIICAGKCVPFPATVYHCDGSLAFKMGYYGRWSGNGKSRGYCASGGAGACSVSSSRSQSRSKKCKGAGYLDVDGTRGKACMRFNLNSDRNGSV